MTQYVVPMYESEIGWGAKVDGYAGPFDNQTDAENFRQKYNKKFNDEDVTPSYYIVALEPVPYKSQKCDYRSTV